MIDDAQPDQIVIRPTENLEGEQQDSIPGSKDEEPEENDNEEPEENKNEDKDIEINVNDNSTANRTSIPVVCKGKMNVEVVPKQGQLSKGVLTVKVGDRMLHKLFVLQQLLCMIGKCMGQRKRMAI